MTDQEPRWSCCEALANLGTRCCRLSIAQQGPLKLGDRVKFAGVLSAREVLGEHSLVSISITLINIP
jgi:hypothetical protein